ncbi:MAG: hypothetical protein U0L26_07660 [Cellulosilyticum sp.]|nr:hypothetical protein [Cellulosilyticum sp.]MEE1072250.1 hypothetical protein [Cellulosilyticum sp.]
MKKRVILAILCLSLLIAGGITAYISLSVGENPDYSSGMFVDRGDLDGYETMHHLYTTL